MRDLKIGQFLVAAGVSFLLFVGVYLTEQSRLANKTTITNPFAKAVELNSNLTVNINAPSKDVFTLRGEFLRIFPDSEMQFEGNKRFLKKGEVFYSSNYISQKDSSKAQRNYFAPFSTENFQPLVGQIHVGGVIVSAPGGSILINYDILREETTIYAHDHSIEVFLPESKTPFILPPKNEITIKKSRLKNTGKLFYSKLKKEFKMKVIATSLATTNSKLIPPKKVIEALAAKKNQFEKIKAYASKLPFTWTRFNPESFMGKLTYSIQYLQRHYAVGYKKEKKKEFQFMSMRLPLVAAFFAFDEKNTKETQKNIDLFSTNLNQKDWVLFIVDNPKKEKDWEVFARSQKIWLKNIFPDDPEKIFKTIWFADQGIQNFKDFKEHFYQTEQAIGRALSSQAQKEIAKLSSSFPQVNDITIKHKFELTKIRRLLGEMLKQETFLRTPETFDLYSKIIQSENTLYEINSENKKEITLEAAQDILFFIKTFINKDGGGEVSRILVKTYKTLGIDEIAQKLGRQIFTESELETIQVVQFINNSNLSEEDIKNIQEQQSLLQMAQNEFQLVEQQEQQNENYEEIFDDSIQTEEDLKKFLVENEINIQAIRIKERKKDDNIFIIFKDATLSAAKVSGTFETRNQIFRFLKIGEISETSDRIEINTSIFSSILESMKNENEKQKNKNNPDVEESGPSNESELAILQRTIMSRKLKNQSIVASRDQIRIMNEDFTLFEVKNATLDNRYKISFSYNNTKDEATNVFVEAGRNQFNLIDMSFPAKTLRKDLRDAIKKELGEDL